MASSQSLMLGFSVLLVPKKMLNFLFIESIKSVCVSRLSRKHTLVSFVNLGLNFGHVNLGHNPIIIKLTITYHNIIVIYYDVIILYCSIKNSLTTWKRDAIWEIFLKTKDVSFLKQLQLIVYNLNQVFLVYCVEHFLVY